MNKNEKSCCSTGTKNTVNKFSADFIVSSKITAAGFIPVITDKIVSKDKWEHFKCRIGKFRDNYKVNPGLYALGNPSENSDIFVSANYKLSFDFLRKELEGLNCWIIVLDTKGINVWCAAGKGTFGTEELINRIKLSKIDKILEHKNLILPQLGAVGISAHEVTKTTGFKIIYGPVNTKDIKSFIGNNYSCSKGMREVNFSLKDRVVLTPIEFSNYTKYILYFGLLLILFFGLKPEGILFNPVIYQGIPFIIAGLTAFFIGTVGVPIFLPVIPFNSFALKGVLAGLITPLIASFAGQELPVFRNFYILIVIWLIYPVISSFLALQFTGSSTYTNPSGVEKELKFALPVYLILTFISIIFLILFKIHTWS